MNDHQPDRELEHSRALERDTGRAYRSIWRQLEDLRALERYHDKCVFKRTGITHPARLYGRKPEEPGPAFGSALQRLWDIGALQQPRADTELRRTYHLIAKPMSEGDVIALGTMPEPRLRMLLPWIAYQLSQSEAAQHVARGEQAPPVITEE